MIDKLKKVGITGGCGFVGRHLVRELLARGTHSIHVLDNLSVGRRECLPETDRVVFFKGDVRDMDSVTAAFSEIDTLFHFAAPTDVRTALTQPRVDIEHGVIGTQNLLERARQISCKRFVFASSSCVYGDGLVLPVAEDAGPLLPVSIYGASKLAAEGLIAAYSQTFGIRSWIYRFPNVVGPELTHGVVLDFVNKLRQDPTKLAIFGDGSQTKTYLWVDDCIQGVLSLFSQMKEIVNVANITTEGSTSVREIAQIVSNQMGLRDVRFEFSGGTRGWAGDVPVIQLSGAVACQHGWHAEHTSSEAIKNTVSSFLLARK